MRTLSGQSIIYGMSGALTKLVGFIIVPILGHIFRTQEFATIDLITAFGSAIGAVILLGSDAAVAFYYYRESDERGRNTLVSTWMIFQFCLNSIAGGLLVLFAGPLTRVVVGPSSSSLYITLTGCAFPLGSTVNFVLEVLRLQMKPTRYLLISAISVLSGLFLSLLLVVALRLGLTGVYLGTLITNTIAFGAAMYALRGGLERRFSTRRLRRLLSYGIPLVPISLSTWAINLSSRFFIRLHSGGSDVGLYAMGNRVAQIMLLGVSAFTLAWGPFALSISDSPDARRTYAKVLTFYAGAMGWITFSLGILAPLILAVVASPQYARAYQVVAPLSCSYAVYGAYAIVATGIALSKKTIHLAWTFVISAVVTAVLNAVLIQVRYLAIAGSALASLAGYLILVMLVYTVAQRLYPIPYEGRKVATSAAILAVAVVCGQCVHSWFGSLSLLGVTLQLALFLLFPVALVAMRVVERYELEVVYGALLTRLLRWARKSAPEGGE